MTRKAAAERQEAIDRLREWLKPGDTVYTICDHVSSSGMSRAIRLVVPQVEGRSVDFLHPNYAAGVVLGLRHWKRHGREQDALVVGGCGMDMGFHLVNSLSTVLYGARHVCLKDEPNYVDEYAGRRDDRLPKGYAWQGGYTCLGKGKCPSNYHVNHRDNVKCDGVDGQFCYYGGAYKAEVVDDHPIEFKAWGRDGKVCPTCNGSGHVPNPAGPERFDLVHTDGYALRHKWL